MRYKYVLKIWLGIIFLSPTRLDFIQSTGSQYIDTRYVLSDNSNNKLFCEFAPVNPSGSYDWIMGSGDRIHLGKTSLFSFGQTSKGLYTEISGKNVTYTLPDGWVSVEMNNDNIVINNETTIPHNGQFVYSGAKIALFACFNTTALYDNNFRGKIRSAQIYDNGVLVRNFVPVLDKQNKPCMYDTVTRLLFYNKGSEPFIAGEIKE